MKTIVCFGDSNTWGANASTRDRYPWAQRWTGLLQRELSDGYRVVEEGLNGRTTNLDDTIEPHRNGLTYLLPCLETHGPIDLITDAEQALVDAGMPAVGVHREIFTTNQVGTVTMAPQEVTETSVAIATGRATLHGRATQFELYDGDSVLDAVQRVRPDAPFSCRSGVCSTCQAVIRDGEVVMAINYGLSDAEVARGYVLTCQSTPTTDTIDVDYDA